MGMGKKRQRGGARLGAGRKPIPASQRRERSVILRFTEAEYKNLEDAAGKDRVAIFARSIVLRSLARRRN